MIRRATRTTPGRTLFPYTTLFRSEIYSKKDLINNTESGDIIVRDRKGFVVERYNDIDISPNRYVNIDVAFIYNTLATRAYSYLNNLCDRKYSDIISMGGSISPILFYVENLEDNASVANANKLSLVFIDRTNLNPIKKYMTYRQAKKYINRLLWKMID